MNAPRQLLLVAATLVGAAVATGVMTRTPPPAPAAVIRPAPDPIEATPATTSPCDLLRAAGQAEAQGPLPDDPLLAAWVERVERAASATLALRALYAGVAERGDRDEKGVYRVDARTAACARSLWAILDRLPPRNRLRRSAAHTLLRLLGEQGADPGAVALVKQEQEESKQQGKRQPGKSTEEVLGEMRDREREKERDLAASDPAGWLRWTTEEYASRPECGGVDLFLRPFPKNARLRRALLLHFNACVEDNFNSIDGDLDENEPLMRATVESWPAHAGLTFELLAAADTSALARPPPWISHYPFGRIPLDLGPTGNALRVARDLVQGRDALREALAGVARRRSAGLPPRRRARWLALLAYLEAGAPAVGPQPGPALALALRGDARDARWALGYIPIELQEHAPRPYPYLRDPPLVAAVEARAPLVEGDDDTLLLLDAASRMPPGTALATIVRVAASPDDDLWQAAIATMNRQLDQLDDQAQASALMAPFLQSLHASLAPRAQTSSRARDFLVRVGEPGPGGLRKNRL